MKIVDFSNRKEHHVDQKKYIENDVSIKEPQCKKINIINDVDWVNINSYYNSILI